MTDHRREALRIIKGSPHPDVSLAEIARQLGVSEDEARGLVDALERDGKLVRDGDRLVVVEPSAAPAEPGEEPY